MSSCSKACKVETIIFKLNNNEDFIVSKETLEMILIEEGYKEFPYVPAATNTSSGVTIGYGYDFGQQTVSQLESDLSGLFTQSEINSFKKVVGLKGVTASKSLNLVSNISTSKDIALKLSAISKKRYAQSTYNIWPEAIKLHPHCQGALLSIVYNRGAKLNGDRRREMMDIKTHLKKSNYEKISEEIKGMKRLWVNKNLGGLLKRRDKEAKFFEKGVNCDCYE